MTRVHHLNAATLCPWTARLVNGAGWFTRGRLVCHCLLVETSSGLVLIDTGIGSEDVADVTGRLGHLFWAFARPIRDPEETALAQVVKMGFNPRDVRHIVPTHLDLDHAGGLPDFPWAEVHINADEWQAAARPRTMNERGRYRAIHWAHGPKWVLRAPGGDDWLGFRSVQAIDGEGDVLLVPLEGHTRGHCGVAVRTDGGWLLHAGDAYFHHAELTGERPRCPPGLRAFQRIIAVDNRARLGNQARLRRLARDHSEVRIHCAHCPVEYDSLAHSMALAGNAPARLSAGE